MTVQSTAEAVSAGINKDGLVIPLIDFGMFRYGSDADRQAVAKGIVEGFRSSGFIYLKNHGISQDAINRVFSASAGFFSRSQEQKDALRWLNAHSNRGYVSHGREKVTQINDTAEVAALRAHAPDLKESLEIGRDNHPRLLNAWPDHYDHEGTAFRKTMVNFYHACQGIHIQLMQAIAAGLGLHAGHFDGLIGAADNNLRLLHYPAVSKEALSGEGHVRAGEHTDYGTTTLLFQDLRGGLQVRSPKGNWIDATPIEGTIIVNAGDLLSRWSNGLLASTEHRVVQPPNDPLDGVYPDRYSCAYFCNPNVETVVEALPGTFSEERPKMWTPINAGTYLQQRLTATYSH